MSKKPKEEITKYGDTGTPERHKRNEIEESVVEGQKLGLIRNISPIHTYYKRKMITLEQFSAGKRMREYWVLAFEGFSSSEYRERIDGGGREREVTTTQVYATQMYKKGLDAAGDYKKLVLRVCCHEVAIAEMSHDWKRRRSLKQELRIALDEVAKVFGYM